MTIASNNHDSKKTVSKPLAKILSEESIIRILRSSAHSHKSAQDLSTDCDVSLSTIYRQIKRLNNLKLLTTSGSIDKTGKKHFMYKSKESVYCKCACAQIDLSQFLKEQI